MSGDRRKREILELVKSHLERIRYTTSFTLKNVESLMTSKLLTNIATPDDDEPFKLEAPPLTSFFIFPSS